MRCPGGFPEPKAGGAGPTVEGSRLIVPLLNLFFLLFFDSFGFIKNPNGEGFSQPAFLL
jgi:hypothetical protein